MIKKLSQNLFKNQFSLISQKNQYFSKAKFEFDATKVFIESISSTVKGIQQVNYIEEYDQTLTDEQKAKMKRFLIYRSNPVDPTDQPRYVSYYIDLTTISPMYLDALLQIKDKQDSTLSIRRSCREGICGSCAMNCDGMHGLACIKPIDQDLTQASIVTPLSHMFVMKDLVVDMTNFYTQYKSIEPFLKRKDEDQDSSVEYYQSTEDRKLLDGLYECVLCACCSTSCPSYWWHPDKYLGPAVLMQAYRWIIDSRDQYQEERLDQLTNNIKLDDCQNIGMCTTTCPKGLDPQVAIQKLIQMVKENKENKKYEQLI